MCIPSSEYIKKTFSNREEYFKKYQDLEKAFSPHPSLLKGNDQLSFRIYISFSIFIFFKNSNKFITFDRNSSKISIRC